MGTFLLGKAGFFLTYGNKKNWNRNLVLTCHILQQSEMKIIKENLILCNRNPLLILKEPFVFIFYFFLKAEAIIPSRGKLILIKKILLFPAEQIFCLVEMSFRNRLLLHVATGTVSCRNQLLMQNLIQANINQISG